MHLKKCSIFVFVLITCSCKSANNSPSVIIIGAGPSGIAAATRLLENNVMDITVLEAEKRIGGRVHSVNFGDVVVDLGAEWCHGQKNNIVYEMVKSMDVLRHAEHLNMTFLYSTKEIIDRSFSDKIFHILEEIYDPDGNREQTEGITVGEYCINKYNSTIAKIQLTNTEINFVNDVLDYYEHAVLSSEGAFSWFDPSAESDYETCEGDLNLNWNGYGFKTVLDVMMKTYPNISAALPIDDKIKTNKEVTKIIWDNNPSGVIVECTDGSIYKADYVIFTPSLGVLKHDHKTLFQPQLPDQKKFAIKKLGIGAVMKVMFHFPKRWWPTNFSGIYLVWSDEHKRALKQGIPSDFFKNGRSWIMDVFAFIPVAKNPNVLSAWITGKSLPDIEKLDNKALLKGFKFIFKQFLSPKYNYILPDSFIRTNWFTNPHFRGSYSYQTIQSRKRKSNLHLSRPLTDSNGKYTLLFAGEATHHRYYSTVHGAIETGYREAERIINISNVIHK